MEAVLEVVVVLVVVELVELEEADVGEVVEDIVVVELVVTDEELLVLLLEEPLGRTVALISTPLITPLPPSTTSMGQVTT